MIDKNELVKELVETAKGEDNDPDVVEVNGKKYNPVIDPDAEGDGEDLPEEMPDQEREAAIDFEDWGWEPRDMVVTQTEPDEAHEEVDTEYAEVTDDHNLPDPQNDEGDQGDRNTGTHHRKREDMTVGEFASLAEDRGERGWTQEEWEEWWNSAAKEKQALEISDYYRVWIKDKEDAPEGVDVHPASDSEVPAPADNTHFYEVPFGVSTAMVPIDEAEKALQKRPEREDFPTESDLRHANLPHADLQVAKAVAIGNVRKVTPSTLTSVESPLTLLYGAQKASEYDGMTWRHACRLFNHELTKRGVVGISRHSRPHRVNTDLVSKYKVYVDSEEEVPDKHDVQTGPQGGLYYEVNTNEEEDEGEEIESGVSGDELEFGGFGVDTFNQDDIQGELSVRDPDPGDRIYVEHPDEPDYIAEIDEVEITGPGEDDWEISFGGGSYTLRADTNSQPVGMVEESPELGTYEEVEPINSASDVTGNVDTGDVITYEDPAGYEHYYEVDGWTQEGDIVTRDGERISRGDVAGVVETTDPTAKYNTPDEDQILSETNLGEEKVEAAQTFNDQLSKAVAEGDATQLPSYNYRDFAGSIFDEDLAIDAYRSILENDGTQTQRRRMEQRMRSMGLDPQEHQPREVEYNPEEVPDTREGTMYEQFDSEKARNTAVNAIQQNRVKKNYSAWNDFFDHMTQAELEESLRTSVTNWTDSSGWNSDPMDYENDDVEVQEQAPGGQKIRNNTNLASCWSRLEGDTQDLVDLANDVIEDAPADAQDYVATSAASWIDDPEARRQIFQEHFNGNINNVDSSHRNRMRMQFANSHQERGRSLIDRYTSSTSSEDTQFARAVARSFDFNEEASAFNKGIAVDTVEPTEELRETFETIRDETAEHIEEEYDGEVTLYRGLDDSVSANAALESWTDDLGTADSSMFDNHAVLEATFEPGDVLGCHEIDQHRKWGYGGYGENEWTTFGGVIAEEVPDDMKVEEVFGDPSDMEVEPVHPTFQGGI